MKRLIAFDLDGTLAQSKQPIADSMAKLLCELLAVAEVAVISGGDWPQFQKQVIARLPKAAQVERLWIMPTTGSKLYRHQDGAWTAVYAHDFTPEEVRRIREALDAAVAEAGLSADRVWGEQIEDRGSQITFSGLGQDAPLAEKSKWDPEQAKRRVLQKSLRRDLPDLSIHLGGTTSVDITQKGVDKAYAVRRLARESGVSLAEMLFMGDATYPGGNDAAVPEAGVDTLTVRDARDCETAVAAVIACLKP